MENQQPLIKPVQPAPVAAPPKQTNYFVIIIILIVILIAIVGVVGYLFGQTINKPTVNILPAQTPVAQTSLAPTHASQSANTHAPVTMPKNANGNTYENRTFGLGFFYTAKDVNYPAGSGDATVYIKEVGNKVYVYAGYMKPESGQYVEKFSKNSNDTLAQAIKKQFLANIPESQCFVKVDKNQPSPTQTKATISYPVPENADQPAFTYGENCPSPYTATNGIAYFLEDSQFPDRYYFFSIGQYGIPAYTSTESPLWQDTVVFLN